MEKTCIARVCHCFIPRLSITCSLKEGREREIESERERESRDSFDKSLHRRHPNRSNRKLLLESGVRPAVLRGFEAVTGVDWPSLRSSRDPEGYMYGDCLCVVVLSAVNP